jgi:hypothetical protein
MLHSCFAWTSTWIWRHIFLQNISCLHWTTWRYITEAQHSDKVVFLSIYNYLTCHVFCSVRLYSYLHFTLDKIWHVLYYFINEFWKVCWWFQVIFWLLPMIYQRFGDITLRLLW